MKIPYAMSLSALAMLCMAQMSYADDAAPPASAAKAEVSTPHWYDAVTGTKFTSVEGSTAQLSLGEDGLVLEVAAPGGSTADKLFIYTTDNLGNVFDASDKAAPVGVFRQSARGIEAEYADGHSEVLSANNGGGLTIAITDPNARLMCMKWYPQGHVFAESERKEALAAYASKLGLASEQKTTASAANCADTPAATASAELKAQQRPAKSMELAATHTPKMLGAPKAVLVRASLVHTIDPVPPEIAQGALAGAPVAAPADIGAHMIQASAHETVPSNRGASNCLSIDSDGQNWGFRNACDNSVQFAYCLQNGKDNATACGSGTAVGGVARNGFFALISSSAVIDDNHQFRWVACSGDAGTVTPHLDRSAPPAGRCVRSQNS